MLPCTTATPFVTDENGGPGAIGSGMDTNARHCLHALRPRAEGLEMQHLRTRPRGCAPRLQGPDQALVAGKAATPERLALVAQAVEEARDRKLAGDTSDATKAAEMGGPGHAIKQGAHDDTQDFLGTALMTEAPFRERLVWFWANHFTVATRNRFVLATAGPYVREAIRPYVTGNFRDMLLAVMRHPAMLTYLDQAKSAGPDSFAGLRHKDGLNENLARECLELHTVSPASGYTQGDVTAFARVLTGWSVSFKDEPRGFVYLERRHEPGEQVVMGRTWPDGEEGGVALLGWLADHPATHRHLAEKLVRHFVADRSAASAGAHDRGRVP